MRMFEPKVASRMKLLPLAAAYVAYIVLCNLNLNINPVGFYQITKIAGAARGPGPARHGSSCSPCPSSSPACRPVLAAGARC